MSQQESVNDSYEKTIQEDNNDINVTSYFRQAKETQLQVEDLSAIQGRKLMMEYYQDLILHLEDCQVICRLVKIIMDDLNRTNFTADLRKINKQQNHQILTDIENDHQKELIQKIKELEIENKTKIQLKCELDHMGQTKQQLQVENEQLIGLVDRYKIQEKEFENERNVLKGQMMQIQQQEQVLESRMQQNIEKESQMQTRYNQMQCELQTSTSNSIQLNQKLYEQQNSINYVQEQCDTKDRMIKQLETDNQYLKDQVQELDNMRNKGNQLAQLQRSINNDKQILNQEQENWGLQYKKQKLDIENERSNIKKLEYDYAQKQMEFNNKLAYLQREQQVLENQKQGLDKQHRMVEVEKQKAIDLQNEARECESKYKKMQKDVKDQKEMLENYIQDAKNSKNQQRLRENENRDTINYVVKMVSLVILLTFVLQVVYCKLVMK